MRDAGTTMGEIVAQVHRVTTLMDEIAAASENQSTSVGQVNAAVIDLDGMTQRNAALAEQGTAAALTLAEQAAELSRAVAVFSFSEAAPA